MTRLPGDETFTIKNERPSFDRIPSFVIRVTQGPDSGSELLLDASQPNRVLVGTSPSCELRLTDRTASRRHVAFELVGPHLHVTDLGSTNGTRVANVRVGDAILSGGEQVRIGETTLTVELAPAEPAERLSDAAGFGQLLGSSTAMRRLYPLCERLAKSDVPVLIEGETGTGKEVLAESLHDQGARRTGPFVVFDCSVVTPSLVESHLFGHEKGAFTGATAARRGVFALADGGTLFIDEIGDLELPLQARLLRAIERGEVTRVGSERWIKVNVRIVAATRRDLDREVLAGRFRDDLFYRLAVARIELPPLRHRHGDIALLARHFWDTLGGKELPLPYELFERFEEYSWPGNVRELLNAVARHVALGDLVEFGPTDSAAAERADLVEKILALDLPLPRAKQRMMEEFERRYVERVLDRHGGNVRRAAEASGIAKRYLNLLKAKHGG